MCVGSGKKEDMDSNLPHVAMNNGYVLEKEEEEEKGFIPCTSFGISEWFIILNEVGESERVLRELI